MRWCRDRYRVDTLPAVTRIAASGHRPSLAVGVGLEPTSSRLTIERWTSSATLQKWRDGRGSNSCGPDRQSGALPLGHRRECWPAPRDSNPNCSLRRIASSPIGWRARRDSNPNLNVRSVLSCPLDDGREEESGWGSRIRTHDGGVRVRCLSSLAIPQWPGRWASNPEPAVPKAAALPIELRPNVPNGVTGENRTLVKRSTVARLIHSATVTPGARGTSRTCMSGFSDRCLDRNGLPGKLDYPRAYLLRGTSIRLSKITTTHLSRTARRLGLLRQTLNLATKTKKEGGHWLVAALFLKSKCYSKTGQVTSGAS